MSDTCRSEDIKELYRMLDSERHPGTRENIRRTINLIKNENRITRSMRESLIKAHRDGRVEEIKDIHDFIKHKQEYGQDRSY